MSRRREARADGRGNVASGQRHRGSAGLVEFGGDMKYGPGLGLFVYCGALVALWVGVGCVWLAGQPKRLPDGGSL